MRTRVHGLQRCHAYNPDGNVTSRSGPDVPGGRRSFSLTPFDLPSSITTDGAQSLFEYTADEESVVRRDPANTRYSVAGLYERLVGATTGETQEQRFRIYAGSRQIAEM